MAIKRICKYGEKILAKKARKVEAQELKRILPGIISDMFETLGLGTNALAADYYDARSKPDPETGFPTAYHPANPAVWESVLPVAVFKGHTVTEITFYPVDIGFRVPRPHQGTPRLADPVLGQKILERLIRMSEIYGTRIVIKDGVGVWEASATGPQ